MITELTHLPGVIVAEVAGIATDGRPLVRWNDAAPIAAGAVWTPGAPAWRDCLGARVLIGFLNADEAHPMILGFLDAPPAPVVPGTTADTTQERAPETLRIEAGRELVIECGEAKISLRKDGRIEIRGTHLISRSSGPNKIKGGSVFIN
jgi:hypothetical protein